MATPQLIHTIILNNSTYIYHPGNDILTCEVRQLGFCVMVKELNLETGEQYATDQGLGKYKLESSDPYLDKLRSICRQLDMIQV